MSHLHQDMQNELNHRTQVIRLLADCYYQPGPDLGATAAELEALASRLDPALAACAAEMLNDCGDLEELLRDYSRLFVGPFSLLAPPYGSIYLDEGRVLMGPSTWAAREQYLGEGLDLSADFIEAPDHIAAELEFLHFLCAREASCLAAGDTDAAEAYRNKLAVFLSQHLGRWVVPFTELVEQEAATMFYRNLARATKLLVMGLFERRDGVNSPTEEGE